MKLLFILNAVDVFQLVNEGKVYYDEENKPGISNLMSLICVVNNMTIEKANDKYENYSYKDLLLTFLIYIIKIW